MFRFPHRPPNTPKLGYGAIRGILKRAYVLGGNLRITLVLVGKFTAPSIEGVLEYAVAFSISCVLSKASCGWGVLSDIRFVIHTGRVLFMILYGLF